MATIIVPALHHVGMEHPVHAQPSSPTLELDALQGCPLKKIVRKHSMFPESPFSLAFYHEDVPRLKKVIVYRWLTQANMPNQILER